MTSPPTPGTSRIGAIDGKITGSGGNRRPFSVSPATLAEHPCGNEALDSEAPDHLFISYATENGDLAEWLTVKLTAEGYAVWCDRTKLLGGESYPADIDHAIKVRTFRLLALLSRASVAKPNPVKERTLALNLARERRTDFLIPLNVDGLRSTELDWMTSDLTFIAFAESWAAGFEQLLKKLRSINAPRPLATKGAEAVSDWYLQRDQPDLRRERLISNRLRFTAVPETVYRLVVNGQPELPIDGHETSPLTAKKFPASGQKMSPRMANQSPHWRPTELPTGGRDGLPLGFSRCRWAAPPSS